MPSAPTAPSTPYSPWSTGSMPPKVDVALMGLESGLTAVLGGQPPEELVVARKERDVLVVRVQKAYYKREEVGVLQWELTKAEMRVKTLEQRWLLAVLSGVEAMVGNIRAGMAPHVQEQSEEDDECAVESEDEDEILEVFQHTVIEPEVQSPEIPAHLERRFIWIRSASSFDSDSDSDAGYDSDSEYEDDGYDSDRLSVPALLHSRSASSSEASSSPIIPGVNDWAPFSAPVDGSEEKKTAGALILRIAGVEMEMI
ncbi:uncharacterized protein LAJ45_06913 [Morchella importuna]|nr:uncharacterized protein LAJ45_06913 [Morchella importuna]KAH8148939.1 hypothetical protein LAJ45_06913 [Morchella importuna]